VTGADDASCVVRIVRWSLSGAGSVDDRVALEEPLELRVAEHDGPWRSVAVVMRTPVDDASDEELATGFLLTEGVIAAVDDVLHMATCTVAPVIEADGNVLLVRLKQGVALDAARLSRHVFSASSCGVCGKATLEAITTSLPAGRVTSPVVVDAAVLQRLVIGLRGSQPLFRATGGTHGAALATSAGEVLFAREDVGRHNAVDKVLGAALRARTSLDDALVLVSGRVAFELVQKCARAGIGVIAGVGAPTSLAVQLGAHVDVAVVGFVGAEGLNVYSAAHRVRLTPPEPASTTSTSSRIE
jgi:FdhD protein